MKTASLDPTAEELGQAERMQLVSSMAETTNAF